MLGVQAGNLERQIIINSVVILQRILIESFELPTDINQLGVLGEMGFSCFSTLMRTLIVLHLNIENQCLLGFYMKWNYR